MIGEVAGHDDGDAPLRQLFHRLQHQGLILEIQMGSRFVEQHDLRLLAHGAGDEHHLPFAAGYLGVAFAGQVFDAQLAHDLIGEFRVLAGGGAQQAQMRRAAHAHHLQ